MYAFNPNTREGEQVDLCEFEANLVYRVSSWTEKATEKKIMYVCIITHICKYIHICKFHELELESSVLSINSELLECNMAFLKSAGCCMT